MWQEQYLPQAPCMAGGLQQALLCTSHQEGLDMRADESCPCQEAFPGSCRRADGARRAGQDRQGWAPAAQEPSSAPTLTS